MRGSGLLEWAAANNMVVLFPQAFDESTDVPPINYPHCWASSFQSKVTHP